MTASPQQSGFSLLELMVTIAVAAMVLAIGVPGFQNVIKNNRIVSVSNELVTAMHLARSEAVKLRTNSVICASDNPAAATPVCGNNFSKGWVAFLDRNGNGAVDTNADPTLDDTILRVQPALNKDIVSNVAGGAYISFAASGYGQSVGALGARATAVVLCDDRGNKDVSGGISAARVVVLTETGRPDTLRKKTQVATYGGCP